MTAAAWLPQGLDCFGNMPSTSPPGNWSGGIRPAHRVAGLACGRLMAPARIAARTRGKAQVMKTNT